MQPYLFTYVPWLLKYIIVGLLIILIAVFDLLLSPIVINGMDTKKQKLAKNLGKVCAEEWW